MVKYKDKNKENFTRSRDILVSIANNTKNKKFENLGINEINRAKVFRDENNKKYTKFKRYKRGTIVFVRFGINIGQEFSNSHFGIVLDKNDNPSNGILTILPLSSKQSNDGVNIGKSLFSTIMNNAEKTNKEAGDGTTSTVVLSHAMAKEGLRYIRSGVNPFSLGKGLHKTVELLTHHIAQNAQQI